MKHIHIVGIAGTFMGGIARLALKAGYRVTGCDENIYPPMSTQLSALGIDYISNFEADQLKLKPDLFVIGNVAKRGMPIIEAILNQCSNYISGPQWLYENVLKKHHVLAVAGTHGKTTTTSMLAWILEYTGKSPGFLIGGVPENFQLSARWGTSDYFVIEADEYDIAFFDKRSKFLYYHPNTLIINNLEFDHADIFENLAAIQKQFHHLIRTIPGNGSIIYNASVDAITEVFSMGIWTRCVPFASPKGYHINSNSEEGPFDIYFQNQKLGQVHWSLLGHYNQLNALAAIAAAKQIGISEKLSIEALKFFTNVKRRMQFKTEIAGISIYDDFAHHPTAITNSIAALKSHIKGKGKLLVIFEPRSNTMKIGTMKNKLISALAEADKIFINSAGIRWSAEEVFSASKEKTVISITWENLMDKLISEAQRGDYILIMSNGSSQAIYDVLLDKLNAKKKN